MGSVLSKSHLAFNPGRAREVAAALERYHREGRGIFRDRDIATPEHNAVRGITDPLHQASLLFFAIGMDRGVQSRVHYPYFRSAYDEDPKLISPTWVARRSLEHAREHFRSRFHVGLTQVQSEMHRSARIIHRRYGGDPRNIFDGITCVHDAVAAISGPRSDRKLPGFGGQVARLLLKNYTELGLVRFPNDEESTPKVDIHAIRIALGTGIVTRSEEGRYHAWAVTGVLNDGYQSLCESGELDGRRFNSLVWSIGNTLCNRKDDRICLHHCPLYERYCSILPKLNYRATGERNDGTVDTRIDDRRRRVERPLFSLDAFAEE